MFHPLLPLELSTRILSYCTVFDITNCANTSQSSRRFAYSTLRSRYSTAVAPFVDPIGFKQLLRDYEAVISGSVALKFLDPASHWRPHDLDVYVPYQGFEHVTQYLHDIEGYAQVSSSSISEADDTDVDGDPQELDELESGEGSEDGEEAHGDLDQVHGDEVEDGSQEGVEAEELEPYADWAGVHRVVRMRRGSVRIDVFCSKTDAALLPITYSWGTAVMNYLGADKWGCAYPTMTQSGQCLVTPIARLDGVPVTDRVRQNISKYEHRGYDVYLSRYDLADLHPGGLADQAMTAPTLLRRFDDNRAFRVTFGVTQHGAVYDNVSANWAVEWCLGGQLGHVVFVPESATLSRNTGVHQGHYM